LPSLTSPFLAISDKFEYNTGIIAYDTSQGVAAIELLLTQSTFQIINLQQSLECVWYGNQNPCHCQAWTEQLPGTLWNATSINTTYHGAPCYNGEYTLSIFNFAQVVAYCFKEEQLIGVIINNSDTLIPIGIATYETQHPNSSYFHLKDNCE